MRRLTLGLGISHGLLVAPGIPLVLHIAPLYSPSLHLASLSSTKYRPERLFGPEREGSAPFSSATRCPSLPADDPASPVRPRSAQRENQRSKHVGPWISPTASARTASGPSWPRRPSTASAGDHRRWAIVCSRIQSRVRRWLIPTHFRPSPSRTSPGPMPAKQTSADHGRDSTPRGERGSRHRDREPRALSATPRRPALRLGRRRRPTTGHRREATHRPTLERQERATPNLPRSAVGRSRTRRQRPWPDRHGCRVGSNRARGLVP